MNKSLENTLTVLGKKVAPFVGAAAMLLIQAQSSLDAAEKKKSPQVNSKHSKTVGHLRLDLEKLNGTTSQDYVSLNALLDKAQSSIPTKNSYTEEEAFTVLESIHTLLASEGFTQESGRGVELLNTVFKDKYIDCDTATTLYLSIGDRLNLPLTAVTIPKHMFVRWHISQTNYLNWEPMGAVSASDEAYLEKWKRDGLTNKVNSSYSFVFDKGLEEGLKSSLSADDLVEFFAMNVMQEAENYMRRDSPQRYHVDKTIAQYYDTRLQSDPSNEQLRKKRMQVLMSHGDYKGALADCNILLSKDPQNKQLLEKKMTYLTILGKRSEAEKIYNALRVSVTAQHK